MTFANLPPNMLQTSKLWRVAWPFIEGNLKFMIRYKQKTILGQPTNTFFMHWWHFAPLQTNTMMVSPLASA
jgi:hypothetical protein